MLDPLGSDAHGTHIFGNGTLANVFARLAELLRDFGSSVVLKGIVVNPADLLLDADPALLCSRWLMP